MSNTTRVPSGGLRELGPVNWLVWRVLSLAAGTPDAHLFSTLGRTGGLFRGWLHYSGRLMPGGRLPRSESELVILRVAHLRDCGYEWDHHTRLGRRAGLTADMIERVAQTPVSGFDERRTALLAVVDQQVQDKAVDDTAWTALAKYYTERELIEIVLLIAQYDGLATTIGILGVQRDDLPSQKQSQ